MLALMRHYYSADAIRDAEAPLLASLPDGALMRRAAFGLATEIVRELTQSTGGVAGRRVCAVVGSGDNGGDALWAATFLRRRGAVAEAVLLSPDRTHRQGLAAFTKAGGRIVQTVSATTDLVIDGVVGISGSGPLRPAAAEVFAAVDAAGIPVVAVDIPSGVDVATGAVTGPAVHAALTVTFGGLKPVHALGDCGRVRLVDIGLDLPDTDVLGFQAGDVAARWPVPGSRDDKYTQGVTGVLAGSSTYPGAAVLCTGAAVATHSGMVRYAGGAHGEVLARWPEVIASPTAGFGRAGAGLGRRAGAGHRRQRGRRAVVRAGHRPARDRRRRRADHPGGPPRAGRGARRADGADPARRRVRPAGRGPARGRPRRRVPQAGRRVRRHRAAQGECHRHRRPRRPGLPEPGRAVLGGHRRVRRRAVRHDRRAAGLGPAGRRGGRGRGVRARTRGGVVGRRPGSRRGADVGVADPAPHQGGLPLAAL